MKLRIQFGKRRERVEVSGDDTVEVLKEEVSVRFSIPPESFDLSLNGKDAIGSEDGSIVSDLGVVSGDLLKVMTNGQDPHGVSSCKSSVTQKQNELLPLGKAGASNRHDQTDLEKPSSSNQKQDDAGVACDSSSMYKHQESGMVHAGSDSVLSGQTDSFEDSSCEADNFGNEPMVVRYCVGDKLPHTLRHEWDSNKPQGIIEALSLLLHVMMLETGFLTYIDSKADICSSDKVTHQTNLPTKWNQFGCCRFSYMHQVYDPLQVCHLACVPLGSLLTVTGLISHETSSSFSLQLKPSEYIKENKDGFSLSNTAKLSRLFKDSVSHRMTCLLREKSGIITQTGILALPIEIQIQILSYLDVANLLNVSEVCQSLLGLSQVNTLWRRLYLRDVRMKRINDHSWKEAYKRRYKEVKDQERAEEECYRSNRYPHYSQSVLPGFYPGALSPAFRGGDYDLYPFGNPFHPLHRGHMHPRRDPIFPNPDQDLIPLPTRGLRDVSRNRGMSGSAGRISFL